MIEFLGQNFTVLIIFAAVVHLAAFLWLLHQKHKKIRGLQAFLQNMVRGFSRHSDIDPNIGIDEQIDRFIKDWEEVLEHPDRAADREALARRDIKDEHRPYLESSLETRYNVVRSAIESYPLLGILGTLFAMALALSQGGAGGEAAAAASATEAAVAGYDISTIIKAFNSAIWSTVWGLVFAVGFLLFNASVENGFERLREHRALVGAIVQKTKQLRLALDSRKES